MAGDYIIEFKQVGNFIKVSAIDTVTFTEISLGFPAGKNLWHEDMKNLAIKRLEYVLKKNRETV